MTTSVHKRIAELEPAERRWVINNFTDDELRHMAWLRHRFLESNKYAEDSAPSPGDTTLHELKESAIKHEDPGTYAWRTAANPEPQLDGEMD